MVGGDQYRDREEGSGGIVFPAQHEPEHSAGKPCERGGLEQHVLVQDQAAQRLNRHHEDMARHAEDHGEGERADDPGHGGRGDSTLGPQHEQYCRSSAKGKRGAQRGYRTARPQYERNECGKADRSNGVDCHRPRDGWIGDEGYCNQARRRCSQEAAAFAHEIALFFLERPEFSRIGNGIADITQGLQYALGLRDRGVVLDQRLLVGEAYCDLVHTG